MRYSIRDLLLLMVIAGVTVAWWLDHRRAAVAQRDLERQRNELRLEKGKAELQVLRMQLDKLRQELPKAELRLRKLDDDIWRIQRSRRLHLPADPQIPPPGSPQPRPFHHPRDRPDSFVAHKPCQEIKRGRRLACLASMADWAGGKPATGDYRV